MKITGRHLLVLIAMCGLLASTVGLVTNVAGLFLTPVAEEFGILKGSASLMMTICNISFAIGGLFVPRVMKEIQFKRVLIVCTGIRALIILTVFIMVILCILLWNRFIIHMDDGSKAGPDKMPGAVPLHGLANCIIRSSSIPVVDIAVPDSGYLISDPGLYNYLYIAAGCCIRIGIAHDPDFAVVFHVRVNI